MAAARASKKKTKKPAPRPAARKKKPAPRKRAAARPGPRAEALAWFDNLSSRIAHAGVPELQVLISEARSYDLVGLADSLGSEAEVLALNRAANDLITAGLEAFGAASPQGFQLQVLRDILNDS